MQTNGTWGGYFTGTVTQRIKNLLLGVLMGAFWFYGNMVYGIGTTIIGSSLGDVIGWPIFMVGMVVMVRVLYLVHFLVLFVGLLCFVDKESNYLVSHQQIMISMLHRFLFYRPT
jgi:uncharacterized membrane protein